MFAIMKKEIKSYFYSPIAYVLIGFFLVVMTILYKTINLSSDSPTSNMNYTLDGMNYILVFIIPILTMRLLSEDMKTKTDILLVTSPLRISEIVFGKFLAAFSVFLVMIVFTVPFIVVSYVLGEPTTAELVGGYVGFILVGMSFIAIGVFASAITENQIIAAVVGFAISLAMLFMDSLASVFGGITASVMTWISLFSRFSGFSDGYIELSAVIYYVSFILIVLYLTMRIIEKRRWSKN